MNYSEIKKFYNDIYKIICDPLFEAARREEKYRKGNEILRKILDYDIKPVLDEIDKNFSNRKYRESDVHNEYCNFLNKLSEASSLYLYSGDEKEKLKNKIYKTEKRIVSKLYDLEEYLRHYQKTNSLGFIEFKIYKQTDIDVLNKEISIYRRRIEYILCELSESEQVSFKEYVILELKKLKSQQVVQANKEIVGNCIESINQYQTQSVSKKTKNYKEEKWFKVGVMFATGKMEKYYNHSKTGMKDTYTAPKIAKELGDEKLNKYILATINNYDITNSNGNKNIFNSREKMLAIIKHCENIELPVIDDFKSRLPLE